MGGTRGRASGYWFFVWFFFVLFYDLLAVETTFLLRERTANVSIFVSLFGNPVDLVRVGSRMALGDPTIFGYAGAVLVKFLGGRMAGTLFLVTGLILWSPIPLVVADVILRRQDR